MDIQSTTASTLVKPELSGTQVKQLQQVPSELDPRGTTDVEDAATKEEAKAQPTEKQLKELAVNMS
ncbi:MAG: hypothetical protein LPD71_06390, partial [Shewanella sp.]|nr:hypothetical protein [Shewanella sp.]